MQANRQLSYSSPTLPTAQWFTAPPAGHQRKQTAQILEPPAGQSAVANRRLSTRHCAAITLEADALESDSDLSTDGSSSDTSTNAPPDRLQQTTGHCWPDSPLLPEEIYRAPIPVVRLSEQAYGYTSPVKLKDRSDEPELLISLYPHGILQLLLIRHPPTAINLIECRLRLFTDQTGLDDLRAACRRVKNDWRRGITDRNHQLVLLMTLKAYEHKHHFYPLEAKLDANFLIHRERITSKVLASAPVSIESDAYPNRQPISWFHFPGTRCKQRESLLRTAVRYLAEKTWQQALDQTRAAIQRHPLVLFSNQVGANRYHLLNQYRQEQPGTVQILLTELACHNVKYQRSGKNIRMARALLAIEQTTPHPNIAQLIDANPGIKNLLANEIYTLHCVHLSKQLTQHPPTSLPALLDAKRQLTNILSLASPEDDQQTLEAQQADISAQLVQLLLFTQSAQDNPAHDIFPTWYVLRPPSSAHIQHVLMQNNNGPENAFYLAALKFLDAQSSLATDTGFQQDLHWLQCYYDVVYHQQQLMVHLIAQEANHPLLPSDQFEQNIKHLYQLASVRKTIGCRAMNPDSYAYALGALNVVWKEEEDIDDTVAELYRQHYLHLLAYDPYTEFKELFFHSARWGSGASRLLCIKASRLIQRFQDSGSADVLDFLYQEGKGLLSSLFSADSPIHTLITETLGSLLAVAQQSPKFFRIMWGDFALLLPQLQSLLGHDASLLAPLQRMALCLRGQALASLFSGDTPRPLDFDPGQTPQYATVIKQFQLLHDIICALHAGLPVLDIFLCSNFSDLEKRLQKVAWNSLSTYLARQCIGAMKPPLIRLSNNLRHALDLMPSLSLGITSDFLASISPDATVRFAHHLGRQGSVMGGSLSYLLDPLILRFDQYKKKIDAVAAEPGNITARKQLAAERKKIGCILGLSSVLSAVAYGFINTFRIVVLFGSPTLGAALMSIALLLISACFLARHYNPLDDVWTSLSEAVAAHMARTYAAGSPKALAARQQAEHISRMTLENIAKAREKTRTDDQNNAFRLALSQYWDQLQYPDDTTQKIKATLNQRWHSEIKDDVQHIQNFVRAKELVTTALTNIDDLLNDTHRIKNFNQQLANLHFRPLEPSLLPYQLINLQQEIDAFLEHSCGTTEPGDTAEAITATVQSYHIALHKGDHLLNILHVRHIESSVQGMASEATASRPPRQLPGSREAGQILTKVRQSCFAQRLQKEQQVREDRMAMVTRRALEEWLKQQDNPNAASIPDLSTNPLFKVNLELQIQLLEKASTPWSRPETQGQHEENSTNVQGSTYQLMAAYTTEGVRA